MNNRQKIINRIVCTILLSFFVVIGISMNVNAGGNPTVYMTVKDRMDIPISYNNGNYYYHSTNLKALKFSETGQMIACARGNATVVLTYFNEFNEPVRTRFNVKIHDRVKNFKWKKKTKNLNIGEKYKYSVKYKMSSKKNVVFEWKSTNPDVATVDKQGNVMAVKEGTTKIQCFIKGQKNAKVSTTLKVKFVPIKSITLDKESLRLGVGKSYNINKQVEINPRKATNQILKTTSSDESVVSVNNGIIYGVGKGQAVVTIETTDGSEKKIDIEIDVNDWLDYDSTKFIAHRGLSAEAPENTIAAYKLAAQKGFYATETDVYITKDNQFVISHDGNLKRMCGVDKNIWDMTLAELRTYEIVNGNNINFYKEDNDAKYIPTLNEYLKVCKQNNIIPMVEIKFTAGNSQRDGSNALYRLYSEIKSVMGNAPCYVISFSGNSIKNMNEIIHGEKDNSIQLCLLVSAYINSDSINLYDYCIKNNIGFSVCYAGNDMLIRKIKSDGGMVGVWTVNDCIEAKRVVDLGVDFIVTDVVLWGDN